MSERSLVEPRGIEPLTSLQEIIVGPDFLEFPSEIKIKYIQSFILVSLPGDAWALTWGAYRVLISELGYGLG
jgi:hypothetical protein